MIPRINHASFILLLIKSNQKENSNLNYDDHLNDEFEECVPFSDAEDIDYPPKWDKDDFFDAQLWVIRAFMLAASVMPLVALGSREFKRLRNKIGIYLLTFLKLDLRVCWQLHTCTNFHDYFWSFWSCCDCINCVLCF